MARQSFQGRPEPQNGRGLYNFQNEHDACGVGLVADLDNRRSHRIVEMGVEALRRLMHRGATGYDPETGDGAGILTHIPDELFRSEKKLAAVLPPQGEYAVGMLFLPEEEAEQKQAVFQLESAFAEEGLAVLAWREVPTDPSRIGKAARAAMPVIRQVFVSGKKNGAEFERQLYVARKVFEKKTAEIEFKGGRPYVVSLSSRSIVYKGLLLATQIAQFYPDLANENFRSALAIVHQRYSTNTFPTWPLAHPFRCLAHNGEINTIRGNLNHMKAREPELESPLFGDDIKKLLPIIPEGQSDSASLDNALELLVEAGRSLPHAMLMLVPQAWGKDYHIGHDVRGFFEYHSALMEPWDGPAAIAFSDGINAGAMLDRSGLRPARYTISADRTFVLASETGVLDIAPGAVVKHGRLGPGQMIYLDLENKRVRYDAEIKSQMARRQPYRRWVQENRITINGFLDQATPATIGADLPRRQKLFGYTREDLDILISAMAQNGQEPIGSMGNDAALAVLSEKPQNLCNYFKQLFAQVTNPPIDPIREASVMSLMTYIGNHGNILSESPKHAHLVKMQQPILTDEDLGRLRALNLPDFQTETISISYHPGSGLEAALERICTEAETAVRSGRNVVILSDRNFSEEEIPIPSLLAVSAVNRRLLAAGIRSGAGIILETGEAREVMHFALLLGFGATAINPYLALETVSELVREGKVTVPPATATGNYIHAVCKGLLKIMSKQGISTLRSFRSAQLFEAVGLSREVIDRYFSGTASRVGGIGLEEIAKEAELRCALARGDTYGKPYLLASGGQYKFRRDGESHLWTPETITLLQQAVRNSDYSKFKAYTKEINERQRGICTLRGLFRFRKTEPIPLEEVESAASIVKRFVTGAMSYGSISPEAHTTIAKAMNELGGMSNSGEGGEDPARYITRPGEISLCSAIKQVASGRFGVTAEYLANAKELQIKIAQGAKPGEGGQLPGHKVNELVARVRHSTPGVTLISPPPHHDIYSIEDLAQLICDLRNANPRARVSVKLVSELGVGTVAAGVAKAHADVVLISGHDGGTGASPLSSIKHAGLPWEIGLAETQQTLRLNKLRDRIRVQVDGQLKTGRDVVIGALMGAEEFGFATTILVSMGCVMMRKCHDNTCPVGIATQDPALRKLFAGKPEHVKNFLMFIAEEAREVLAQLGLHSIDEAVGRTDLLDTAEALKFWKTRNLDFSAIFAETAPSDAPRKSAIPQERPTAFDDEKLIPKLKNSIEKGEKALLILPIRNKDRSVGTRLSYHIASRWGHKGLPEDTIRIEFDGCAGQSFGAFLAAGVTLTLKGEANDYVGKGLSGGKIVVMPPPDSRFVPEESIIVGNVIGYGATAGKLFVNGLAGERFAIRNSGMTAVVEGTGDHTCEYMTGGHVIVLGSTGINFAAGMTGGIAYVLDETGDFDLRCNLATVDLESVLKGSEDEELLLSLIKEHLAATGSPKAGRILDHWEDMIPKFVKVFPVEYRQALGRMSREDIEAVNRTTHSN